MAKKEIEQLQVIKERMISAGIDEEEVNLLVQPLELEIQRRVCGLVWEHKDTSIPNMHGQLPSFVPVSDKNIVSDIDNGQNHILIEGENLLALIAMQYTHIDENGEGMIDVIYIDPPYNTGSVSFAYNDKFEKSEWLSMMNIRLKLARNLLKDSGVIFISINGEYHAELKLICDDIFGSHNYITNLIWQTKNEAKGIPPKNMCVINHEYIVTYSKTNTFQFFGIPRNICDGFSNPDNDKNGPWKRQYLQRFGQGFSEKTIENPINGMKFTFETPYTKDKLDTWIKEGRIIFPENPNAYPAKKEYFNEYSNPNKPILSNLGLYSTKVNSEYLKSIFNGKKVFNYSKPLDLIKTVLKYSSNRNAVIFDFFAGSGTTGHAVLELNKEDSGHRQFILCTNNELGKEAKKQAKKKGYKEGSEEYESLGVCHAVTYPRMQNIFPDYPDNNLYYYRVHNTIDESAIDDITIANMTSKAVFYVVMKENTFNSEQHENYIKFYGNGKEIIVVTNPDMDQYDIKDEIVPNNFSCETRKVYCSVTTKTIKDGIEYVPYPKEVLKVLQATKKYIRKENE